MASSSENETDSESEAYGKRTFTYVQIMINTFTAEAYGTDQFILC